MSTGRDQLVSLRHEDLVSLLRTTFDVTSRAADLDAHPRTSGADTVLA